MDFLPSQERSLCNGPYGENSLCDDRRGALPHDHCKGLTCQLFQKTGFALLPGEHFPVSSPKARPSAVPKGEPLGCSRRSASPRAAQSPFFRIADQRGLCDDRGGVLPRDHCKANFPHRGHRKTIALAMEKSPSQSDFIAKRSDRYARHHCIVQSYDCTHSCNNRLSCVYSSLASLYNTDPDNTYCHVTKLDLTILSRFSPKLSHMLSLGLCALLSSLPGKGQQSSQDGFSPNFSLTQTTSNKEFEAHLGIS